MAGPDFLEISLTFSFITTYIHNINTDLIQHRREKQFQRKRSLTTHTFKTRVTACSGTLLQNSLN